MIKPSGHWPAWVKVRVREMEIKCENCGVTANATKVDTKSFARLHEHCPKVRKMG